MGVRCTTAIACVQIILSAFLKTLKLIYLSMKHRRIFGNLPGFPGNGDWFFGHTFEIGKIGHVKLLK